MRRCNPDWSGAKPIGSVIPAITEFERSTRAFKPQPAPHVHSALLRECYTILVVDDDDSIAAMHKAILESQGYEVNCAANGFDGLTTLQQSPPDVIISDLQMPNMSGFEFLTIVRKCFPSIPTIAISGAFSGRDVPESVLADAFFEKGQYSREELFREITALLEEIPVRTSPTSGFRLQ